MFGDNSQLSDMWAARQRARTEYMRAQMDALMGVGSGLRDNLGMAGMANANPEKKTAAKETPPMKPKSYREELQAEIDEWLR